MKVNATITLACGHVVPFPNYHESLVPRLGDKLWCYECRDTQAVVQVETDAPTGDDPGPSGKESEYGWS